MSRTPAELCVAFLQSFAAGDSDVVISHVTADFVNEHTAALGSSCAGREEYGRRVPGFLASMPELRYDVEDVSGEGQTVWIAYTLRAHVNERDVAVRGAMHFLVRDDLIARRTDYWDSLVFKQQAGIA